MARSVEDTRRRILRAAARVFYDRGYAGAGMEDVAKACGLTKAGLYHHVASKQQLLFEVQSHGMDVFEAEVLQPASQLRDPLQRLSDCLERNVMLLTRRRSREIAVILQEHATLRGRPGSLINARKKRYVRFLEEAFAEAMREGKIRPVEARVAAFSFLGMVLWLYKWYQPAGAISPEKLARAMNTLLLGGLVPRPEPAAPAPRPARKPRRSSAAG